MDRSRSSDFLKATALASALAVVATARAQRVVFSDDFSSSLASGAASSSDYALVPLGTSTLPPDYRVINDPARAFTNGYSSYFDHTTGTLNGAMLFFDGSANVSDRVYYHTLALSAGTPYTVSYWAASGSFGANPDLHLEVNGATIGSDLPLATSSWKQSSTTFTPSASGTYTFAIYDSITVVNGDDGSVDDFLVTAPNATPEPSALAALSLGAFGMLRRPKRA